MRTQFVAFVQARNITNATNINKTGEEEIKTEISKKKWGILCAKLDGVHPTRVRLVPTESV